ncbi:jg21599, partial [Pararge aegeria aegeria]
MADCDAAPGCSSDANKRKKQCSSASFRRKLLKTHGKEYVSTSEKVIPAVSAPGAEILCKCSKSCKDVSHEQKLKIFKEYYDLDSHEEQGSYLMGLINILPIKRRRNGKYLDPKDSKRQCTVSYTLPDGKGNIIQVCRKTFSSVFGLKQKKIHVLVNRIKNGELTYEEKRGNKIKHRKYSEDIVKLIKEHVATFPREESHYGRARSQKEYLSPDLNINRLYNAFKVLHPDITITYKFYSDTFKANFKNLKFGRKRTDTCATCDLLNALAKTNGPDRETNATKLRLHQCKANRAMDTLKRDVVRSQMPGSLICTATMDLQQVLSTPALTHSQMYYSRQLSNFNLGIHIGDTNDAYMCLWHEGITGRGGNEIASCVLKVFSSGATNKKKLIMWSDNCAGQNKNRMIILLWIYLIKLGIFDEIEHKFLITGHSYLNCDRDFALIEKRKKLCSPMVPNDLIKMIEEARYKPFK